jgi:hypothetical protein
VPELAELSGGAFSLHDGLSPVAATTLVVDDTPAHAHLRHQLPSDGAAFPEAEASSVARLTRQRASQLEQ